MAARKSPAAPAGPTHPVTVNLAVDPAALTTTAAALALEVEGAAVVIKTAADYEIVAGYLQEKLREKDALAAMKKQATGPLTQLKKVVDGWFKPAELHLATIEKACRDALGAYQVEQSRARAAALAAATVAATAGDMTTAAAELTTANTETKAAGVSVRVGWVAIEDPNASHLIPEEYTRTVIDWDKVGAYTASFSEHETPAPLPGFRFELHALGSRVCR